MPRAPRRLRLSVTIPSLQLLEISQISQISRGIGSCVASAVDTHAYRWVLPLLSDKRSSFLSSDLISVKDS